MFTEAVIVQLIILAAGIATGYFTVRQQTIKTARDQVKDDNEFELAVQKIAGDLMDRQKNRIADLEQRLETLEGQLNSERSKNQNYENRIKTVEQQLEHEKLERLKAENKVKTLEQSLHETTIARNERIQRIGELEKELESLRERLAKVEKRDTGPLKG